MRAPFWLGDERALLLFEGGVDFEFDGVADVGDAHRDAEVAALDRGFGLEAHGFLLVHADARAVEIDVEGDGPGHAVEREIAGDFGFVAVVVDAEGDEAKVMGNLTLNGVTKPVTLDVDFHGAGVGMNKKETVGFEAETTIKRSDFGVSMGIPMVSDEVELEIHAAFEKQ